MRYKCPNCGNDSISYKQKFLAGYVSTKYQKCPDCNGRFEYSKKSKQLSIVYVLVMSTIIIIGLLFAGFDFTNIPWPLFIVLLGIPFVVHFGELVIKN